jgi:hypothetical protein
LTADLEDGILVIREKGAAASEEDKQAE